MQYINPYRFEVAITGVLYDDYPFDAGWSTRELNPTNYTGYCLKVRRTSDNTEQDIGFSGGEVDTASLASFCSGTDGHVVTWYDQSGNGYNLTQATAGTQPRIVSGGTVDTKNSLPAIYWANKRLGRAALSMLASGNAYSIFSASSCDTSGGAGAVIHTTENDSNRMGIFHDRSSGNTLFYIQTGSGGYAVTKSAQRDNSDLRLQVGIATTGKNMSGFDNGATGSTNTYVGSYTNQEFRVGQQFLDLTGLTGHIAEIILYDTDESSNRSGIETNINDYWGIY